MRRRHRLRRRMSIRSTTHRRRRHPSRRPRPACRRSAAVRSRRSIRKSNMGISLAVIDADVAGWAGRELDLVAIEEEPNTVTLAEARGQYAVGKLGKLTLLTAPKIPDHAG